MQSKRAAFVVLLVCGLSGLASADTRARSGTRADVVAVLPLATDEGLAIYSKPTADALARSLAKSGARVESVSLTGELPGRVALVVDGRIARVAGGKVVIEARVRDPRRASIAVPTITTSARSLARIDKLADSLARSLAPKLLAALAKQAQLARKEAEARRTKKVIRLPSKLVPGQVRAPGAHQHGGDSILVFHAGGHRADSGIVTRHAHWLAERLGYRPVASGASAQRGIPPTATVIRAMRAAKSSYGLLVYVRRIELLWRGVLTARGRVRVMMVDELGKVIFDRTARTGTLVGSRGEGPDALIHYVAEQAMDILLPHLKRMLAARAKDATR